MTRKDYILITARLKAMLPAFINDNRAYYGEYHCAFNYANGYRAAINQVIGALSTDNPSFDVDRFRAACGLSEE